MQAAASFVHRSFRRFRFALYGILHGCRADWSIRTSFFLGVLFLAVFIVLTWPLRESELLFLGLAWVLVLITEFQNSSLERALDALHPDTHDDIGRSKDLASAAAFIAALFALAVVLWIVAVRLF